MKRVEHLRKYILDKYPNLPSNKMDVIKIGMRIYLILVTKNNTLAREKLYRGPLESVNGVYQLMKLIDDNLDIILTKHGYK
jgi:hypothetical protein